MSSNIFQCYDDQMQLTKYFGSGIKRFFSGMALSRVTGLGRDLMMAYAFGDHAAVAAFIVAFRFANVLRRFFGEGPLQSAFIPQFEGLRSINQEEAYAFFRKLSVLIGGLVVVIVLVGEVGLRASLGIWSEGNREIVLLMGWILPSLLFISLYGLNISLLQCHHRFFVSSMAPALCNILWIVGAFVLREKEVHIAMLALSKWVLVGFVIQWGVTAWQMKGHLGSGKWFARPFFHVEVSRLAKAFSLGALGVGASQINAFLDALFARSAHISGPVYLWYANRFQQLAFAIFGIAVVNTLVPILSRAIKQKEIDKGKKIFAFGSRRLISIMVPMTFAIAAMGYGAIDWIFGRGSFALHGVDQTAKCLSAYGLALVPSTLVILSASVLYAEGNFKTATWISMAAVAINVGLNSLFVFGLGWGPISISCATSIGAWFNFFALYPMLKKRGYAFGISIKEGIFLILGSALASVATFLLEPLCRETFSGKFAVFAIPGTVFVGVVALLFWKRFFNNRSPEASVIVVENN